MVDLAAIVDLAGRQHGAIARAQLRALPTSRMQVDRLVRTGVLTPIGGRTLLLAGWPRSPKQRLMAACLDTGGYAANRSAGALLNVGELVHPSVPEVICDRSRQVFRSPIARVHTSTWLPSDDLVVVDGIPCTSVARTLLSLAAPRNGIAGDALHGLIDRAVADRKATDAWLWWRLERLRRRGRPGIAALEAVLARRAEIGPTESWLERAFVRLLEAHGIPLPRCQQRIGASGAFVARVDFIYEDLGIVIEVLGHEFHAAKEQATADARRRNHLQLAGYRVLEFTYDDIVHHPERVVSALQLALAGSTTSPSASA